MLINSCNIQYNLSIDHRYMVKKYIMKSINNIFLNDISLKEGVKIGIIKKNSMILVHDIIKYLKKNGINIFLY